MSAKLRGIRISWRILCTQICLLAAGATLGGFAHASQTESPEKEVRRIASMLKPIGDSEWKEIAGEQIAGKYEIHPGDTLYDISKRLFGDSRYWPKIWALNNNTILNPHLIHPGNLVAFMPGSGNTLPSVEIESTDDGAEPEEVATDAEQPILPARNGRSQEWRNLPPQPWETTQLLNDLAVKKDIKVMGKLDRVSTANLSRELPIFATSKPVDYLGWISSAPTVTSNLKVGDQVLVKSDSDDIKDGEIYAIVSQPDPLEKDDKKRQGSGYFVLGEIQTSGKQDDLWVAQITQARGFIQRGTFIIPRLPRIKPMDPVPAPAAVDGIFYLDHGYSTYVTGQHGFGFVNLGSEDGLQQGMILESFQPNDQNTGLKLSTPDLFHVCDLQVVQVSEQYSTLRVIAGTAEIAEGTPLRLQTDVSRFLKYGAIPGGQQETPPPPAETPPENLPEPIPEPSPAPVVMPAPEPSPAPVVMPAPEPSPAPVVMPAPVTVPEPAPVPPPVPSPETLPEVPPVLAPPAPAPAPDLPPPPPVAAPTPVAPKPAKNELDDLDGDENLDANEKKELQQLENYKNKNPAAQPDLPPPAAGANEAVPPPAPADQPPPPPNLNTVDSAASAPLPTAPSPDTATMAPLDAPTAPALDPAAAPVGNTLPPVHGQMH